jgi:hypothetical protein
MKLEIDKNQSNREVGHKNLIRTQVFTFYMVSNFMKSGIKFNFSVMNIDKNQSSIL